MITTKKNMLDIVYIETLLYIVHVDDIELPLSAADEVSEEMYDGGDEQQTALSNKLIRRVSKRTTASFNERHHFQQDQTAKVPIYTRPSFSFSNPLRRLNSLLKANDKATQSPSTPKLNGKSSLNFLFLYKKTILCRFSIVLINS
jgi:hypothetical protein